MIFTSANKTLTLIFLSQSRFTFLKTKKRMTECHKLLLNAPGGFLHFFLPGALDLQRHFFPSTKTKNNYCHTNTINTLSEKETVQVTSNEQSLVIWRIPLAGRLLFNTSVSPQWYWNETQQITTVWWCQTEKCCVWQKKRKLPIRSHAKNYHAPPPLTDNRASSVHFNILFIHVYRCALLARWCAHQQVEHHIFNLRWLVSVCCASSGSRDTSWPHRRGRRVIWQNCLGGGGEKKNHRTFIRNRYLILPPVSRSLCGLVY